MPESKLTVVQVVPALHSGGVERGTLEVAAELVRRGHRSLVVSGGGRLVEQLEAEGSEHISWAIGRKSPATLRHVRPLRRLLIERGANILHARSRTPAWVAHLAWRRMPTAIRPAWVTTCHGLHSVSRYSAIMTSGQRVIAVSRTVESYIRENYPAVPLDRVRVIHRGVDPARFPRGYQPNPQWRSQWLAAHPELVGARVLALPGRLTRLKGHLDLVELLRRLGHRDAPVVGLVIGGEESGRKGYVREIRERAAEAGLKNLVFAGHRPDIREVYAASDLVLALSRRPESFGRTVLEALSLGVPVVGYDLGGVGEVLGEIYPAGRVPCGDVDQLTERVEQFLSDPPPVPDSIPWTLKAMLDQTIDLYHEVAGVAARAS